MGRGGGQWSSVAGDGAKLPTASEGKSVYGGSKEPHFRRSGKSGRWQKLPGMFGLDWCKDQNRWGWKLLGRQFKLCWESNTSLRESLKPSSNGGKVQGSVFSDENSVGPCYF